MERLDSCTPIIVIKNKIPTTSRIVALQSHYPVSEHVSHHTKHTRTLFYTVPLKTDGLNHGSKALPCLGVEMV